MLLVSSGTDLKLHDCSSYELVHLYRPDSSGQIRSISWCKDGSWLAMVPYGSCAEIIRTRDDIRPLQTILGIAHPTAAVFQRTVKRNIAMSTASGNVLIYDVKTKGTVKQFVNSDSPVVMLDWSYKDTHLASGSVNGQVTLYSNATNQRILVLTTPNSKSVSAVRFHSTQGHILGTASEEGVVSIWDVNSKSCIICLKSHEAPVTDLVYSCQNSKLMVSVGLDRTFQCYDINAGIVALSVTTDHPLSAVDMAQDGHTLAAASSRGTIYIYDLRKYDTPIKTIPAHFGEIKNISFQPYIADTTDSQQGNARKPAQIELQSSISSVGSSTNILNNVTDFSSKSDALGDIDQIEIKRSVSDSFLNVLEGPQINFQSFIKEKTDLTNLRLCENVRKWLETKRNNLERKSSTSYVSSKSERISDIEPTMTSTPRHDSKDRISVPKNDELVSKDISSVMSVEDLNKTINTTVKEVVAEQISDLTDALSHFFLNLQLCVSKQFVSHENQMEQLFDCYYGSAANSNLLSQVQQLQEENEFLRRKINELLQKTS